MIAHASYRRKVVALMRRGHSVNDLQRAFQIPQRTLQNWRTAAKITPMGAGYNTHRQLVSYLAPVA